MSGVLNHILMQALTAAIMSLVTSLNGLTWNDVGYVAMGAPALATLITTTFNKFMVHK